MILHPPSGNAHGWNSVESWDVSSTLNAGNNDLWTMTRNYAWGGGPYANPTGLIYGLCYEYDIPDTVIATETAWGDGTDFDHPNWAMYFTYKVWPCLVGDWLLDVNDGTYMHDMFIVSQDSSGALSGTGGYPASGLPYNVGYDWTLTGQLTGNSVNLVIIYTNGYTATLDGSVDPSCNSMSGTGTAGVATWVATRLP